MESRHTLPAGQHEFKFAYEIQTDDSMPSSFDCRPYCIICYGFTAHLERPPSKEHICEKKITYVQAVEINRPLLQVNEQISVDQYQYKH